MSQLFRSRSDSDTGSRLESELQQLERQAQTASPGYETQFLNRAGNLCVDAGQPQRALSYFGRAIDLYLESGRFSAAEVLCRKVLKIAPDAVRTRSTLAWLALGKGYRSETDHELREYVDAARRAGREELATKQLVMMAQATSSMELRERLAEYLLELGGAHEADQVLGAVYAERNGLRPPPVTDEGKLWEQLLRAALMGPQELTQHSVSVDESHGALPALTRDD